jgi:hypothetical protein
MQNNYAVVVVFINNGQTDLKCCMKNMDRSGDACFIKKSNIISLIYSAFNFSCCTVLRRMVGDD